MAVEKARANDEVILSAVKEVDKQLNEKLEVNQQVMLRVRVCVLNGYSWRRRSLLLVSGKFERCQHLIMSAACALACRHRFGCFVPDLVVCVVCPQMARQVDMLQNTMRNQPPPDAGSPQIKIIKGGGVPPPTSAASVIPLTMGGPAGEAGQDPLSILLAQAGAGGSTTPFPGLS